MQFENLDKRIREAAEQHHPPYDEKAWRKMEKLLNQHLPLEKDDRRRALVFLLLFLLIGGGTLLMISRPWVKQAKSADSFTQNKKKIDQPTTVPAPGINPNNESERNQSTEATTKDLQRQNLTTIPMNRETRSILNSPKVRAQHDRVVANTVAPQNSSTANRAPNLVSTNDHSVADESSNVVADQQNKKDLSQQQQTKPVVKSNEPDITKVTEEQKQQVSRNNMQDIAKTGEKPSAKKMVKGKNGNGFSFSVSAGPDVSKAGSSTTGKTTIVYGAGVGYTLNKFTLRTGLYVAKKIYWAKASDYKLNYAPPPTVKFLGANANCNVFEIPVRLSYNFAATEKGTWFAGAGLSSYLMKKERYVYLYKTATGSSSFNYQTKNENKHYFSVLDLSAGYSRQLNKTFSITAEPYVEIPATGIGVGKVKLNSGGVLFTVGVKPFK